MRVEYDSNNSGGGWWVKDEGWKALEEAGWSVYWGERVRFVRDASGSLAKDKDGNIMTDKSDWRPKNYADALARGKKERYLDALATSALSPEVESVGEAIRSWEKATGLDASAEGCNCCGPPHTFEVQMWNEEEQEWETDWEGGGSCSGDGCLSALFPKSALSGMSQRELMEEEAEIQEDARNGKARDV